MDAQRATTTGTGTGTGGVMGCNWRESQKALRTRPPVSCYYRALLWLGRAAMTCILRGMLPSIRALSYCRYFRLC